MGRRPIYGPDVEAEILRRLAEGESLRSVCRTDGMPDASTVIGWAMGERPEFANHYARAREIAYRLIAEDTLDIADDKQGDPQRDRLRVDTRKWIVSKMLPKIYGDRKDEADDRSAVNVVIRGGLPDGR